MTLRRRTNLARKTRRARIRANKQLGQSDSNHASHQSRSDQISIEVISGEILNMICTLLLEPQGSDLQNQITELLRPFYHRFQQFAEQCATLIPDPRKRQFQTTTIIKKPPFLNYSIVDNDGGGSCFYKSVSNYLFQTQDFHQTFRVLAIMAVLENWRMFEHLCAMGVIEHDATDNISIDTMAALFQNLAQIGCWATNGAIYSICLSIKRNILIQVITNQDESIQMYTVDNIVIECPVMLQLINITHYRTILPNTRTIRPQKLQSIMAQVTFTENVSGFNNSLGELIIFNIYNKSHGAQWTLQQVVKFMRIHAIFSDY